MARREPVALDLPTGDPVVPGQFAGRRRRKRGSPSTRICRPASVGVIPGSCRDDLDNILSNAINYSHDGARSRRLPAAAGRRRDGSSSATAGSAFPAEKLPRIFDDYFRTSEAAKHNRARPAWDWRLCARRRSAAGWPFASKCAAAGTLVTLDFPAAAEGDKPV